MIKTDFKGVQKELQNWDMCMCACVCLCACLCVVSQNCMCMCIVHAYFQTIMDI